MISIHKDLEKVITLWYDLEKKKRDHASILIGSDIYHVGGSFSGETKYIEKWSTENGKIEKRKAPIKTGLTSVILHVSKAEYFN